MDMPFLVFPLEFLRKGEVLEELLRERTNYYRQNGMPITFWILPYPFYTFETVNNSIASPYFAIISANTDFLIWLSLRLGENNCYLNSKLLTEKDAIEKIPKLHCDLIRKIDVSGWRIGLGEMFLDYNRDSVDALDKMIVETMSGAFPKKLKEENYKNESIA